jgi:hypothetical protein
MLAHNRCEAYVHWNQDSGKIGENAQSSVGKVKHRPVHACPVSDAQVPTLRNRIAAKHIGQHTCNVVTSCNEYENPDGDVEIATRKNARIEQQHRHLEKSSAGAVDDGGNEVELLS